MTAKRQKKEKDVIDLMLDQLDFHGMTRDELTGKDGLLRQLTSRFYERILNAEMDGMNTSATKSTTMPEIIPATAAMGIVKRQCTCRRRSCSELHDVFQS